MADFSPSSNSFRCPVDKLQGNRDCNQDNNNPLEHFHAAVGGLGRGLFVDGFQGLKFTNNTRVPFVKVEALVHKPVDPGKVLIAQEFESVVHALEEDGIVYLKLGDAPRGGAEVTK